MIVKHYYSATHYAKQANSQQLYSQNILVDYKNSLALLHVIKVCCSELVFNRAETNMKFRIRMPKSFVVAELNFNSLEKIVVGWCMARPIAHAGYFTGKVSWLPIDPRKP